jgi:L-alanine-DL-glutamate epimerase-like enolase superfamily enzyme
MKIVDIVPRVLRKEMAGGLRNPRLRWRHKQVLLVFVIAEGGMVGVGETWSDGGAADPLLAFLDQDLKPMLIGRDVDLIERFWAEALDRALISTRRSTTWQMMSAIDIALWDIRGKRCGLPLWRLLGGDGRPVLAYASGGLYRDGQDVDAFGAEYGGFVRQGFTAVKIKVGGAGVAVDAARVAALRRHAGPEALLMVDAVSACDVPHALRLARAIAPHDITWFEQPLVLEDLAGMARIQVEGGIPVCGNESEYGLTAFRRLIDSNAVHYVQYDVTVSGGLSFGRKIAALAEAFHRPVTLHQSNSIVCMAANLHLAAALPNSHSIEYHVIHQPLFERAPHGFLARIDGRIAPPERPGLGIDLADILAGPPLQDIPQ